MKLLQELVDRYSSVNPPKTSIYKQLANYTSCSMILHGFTDQQTAVVVDCTCVMETVYYCIFSLYYEMSDMMQYCKMKVSFL